MSFKVLFAQVTQRINKYISGIQPRYMKGIGHVLSSAAILQPYPVMGLMMMMIQPSALPLNATLH